MCTNAHRNFCYCIIKRMQNDFKNRYAQVSSTHLQIHELKHFMNYKACEHELDILPLENTKNKFPWMIV